MSSSPRTGSAASWPTAARPTISARRTCELPGSAGADALHLPVYSLLGEPLGDAGRRAIELAREAGALVSVDLASIGPLLADGRRSARALIADVAPDLLFATASEAAALLGGRSVDGLLEFAAAAVVKRGPKGATVLARVGDDLTRFEVATEHVAAADTTGAGDAFDAGFLVGWFAARAAGRVSAGVAPTRGRGRPSRGDAASCRRHGRSCRSGDGRRRSYARLRPMRNRPC